jgi:hypothetical protein
MNGNAATRVILGILDAVASQADLQGCFVMLPTVIVTDKLGSYLLAVIFFVMAPG